MSLNNGESKRTVLGKYEREWDRLTLGNDLSGMDRNDTIEMNLDDKNRTMGRGDEIDTS
jgi:hypothetical protein